MEDTVLEATESLNDEQLEQVNGGTAQRENIESQVIRIISNQLDIDASRIHLGSALTSELGVDEPDMLDILRELQEVFGIYFSEKAVASFFTVEDIIRQINLLC